MKVVLERVVLMFPDLSVGIQKTEGDHATAATKVVRCAGLAVLSVIAFGGLLLAILALE
jgi:hypothetical protein